MANQKRNELQKLYIDARKHGYTPKEALRAAKIVMAWHDLEDRELVRLRIEPEQESYFDVYGEPEGYEDIHGRHVSADEERKRIERLIELVGNWYVVSEYRPTLDDEWEQADSIGHCCGYDDGNGHNVVDDWRYNWYVPDLMSECIDQWESAVNEDCETFDAAYG